MQHESTGLRPGDIDEIDVADCYPSKPQVAVKRDTTLSVPHSTVLSQIQRAGDSRFRDKSSDASLELNHTRRPALLSHISPGTS